MDLKRGVARGHRELKGGYEILEVPLPVVVSVTTACNEPRFMDYRIKPWAFEAGRGTVWAAGDLDAEENHIGLNGSPTIVSGLAEAPSRERKKQFLEGSPAEIAQQLLNVFREDLPK